MNQQQASPKTEWWAPSEWTRSWEPFVFDDFIGGPYRKGKKGLGRRTRYDRYRYSIKHRTLFCWQMLNLYRGTRIPVYRGMRIAKVP